MSNRLVPFCIFFLCSAGLAVAQQNRAYTGGSGDGYSMAEIQIHSNPTGLEDALEQAIQLYPNPLQEGKALWLEAAPSAHVRQVELRDASGRLLFMHHSLQYAQPLKLNLPTDGLPAGIYLLRLSSPKASIFRKIVLL